MPASPSFDPLAIINSSCCGTEQQAPVHTRFHFSLNVSDLDRSVEFYRKFFDCPPAKHYPDYAKFELPDPPLVFSLVPNPPGSQGALSHLGFPVTTLEDVQAAYERLVAAGLTVTCQNGTVCGYARQDKVWVADPDHNYWEIYVVHEDIDPATVRSAFDGQTPDAYVELSSEQAPQRQILEHRVTDGIPDWEPYPESSVDDIRLTGTFNSALSETERHALLEQAYRILKPGGEVDVHGLVSNQPVQGTPQLSGMASLVKQIPVESQPIRELLQAGFGEIEVVKLPEKSVFQFGDIEMREVKLHARKPSPPADSTLRIVVYKGPFASFVDDTGLTFLRGIRTSIDSAHEARLARSSAARNFLFIQSDAANTAACS